MEHFPHKKKQKSPNFLDSIFHKKFSIPEILFILLSGLILASAVIYSPRLFFLFVALSIIIFFSYNLHWAIFILSFFAFFLGWQVNFGSYNWSKNIPYLGGINGPAVDFISILILISIIFTIFHGSTKINWKSILGRLKGWQWYLLFLITAFISFTSAYDNEFATSLKYFFRPMVFVYVAFVFLPVILIYNKQILNGVLKLWYWIGVAIATFGLSSFLFASQSGWLRAVPYNILSFAPLGYNHNLLAEPLVIIIPIGFYFFLKTRKSLYLYGAVLMIITALLTLSRAAWISLILEALIFGFIYKSHAIKWYKKTKESLGILVIIIILPIFFYMGLFLGSTIVKSSTFARLEMSQIMYSYFERAPLIGYGPGTFILLLRDTYVYRVEFGDPLESHGFLQKIALEEGIIGLFFFLAFLFNIVYLLWKNQKKSDDIIFTVLFLSVSGIISFQLFNTSYFNSVMWIPIGVSIAALGLYQHGYEKK